MKRSLPSTTRRSLRLLHGGPRRSVVHVQMQVGRKNVDCSEVLERHAHRHVEFLPLSACDSPGVTVVELHPELRDMSFYPPCEVDAWFSRPHAPRLPVEALSAALGAVPEGTFVVVGRFHEAFAAYRMTRVGSAEGASWLVLDSHVRVAGLMGSAALEAYIRMELGGSAYSLIVLVVGRMRGGLGACAEAGGAEAASSRSATSSAAPVNQLCTCVCNICRERLGQRCRPRPSSAGNGPCGRVAHD